MVRAPSSFNAISSSRAAFAGCICVDGNQNLQTLNLGDAVAIEGFLKSQQSVVESSI